jgi:hypothetical protein
MARGRRAAVAPTGIASVGGRMSFGGCITRPLESTVGASVHEDGERLHNGTACGQTRRRYAGAVVPSRDSIGAASHCRPRRQPPAR